MANRCNHVALSNYHSFYNSDIAYPTFARVTTMSNNTKKKYRSQEWFDNPDNPGMTALYIERYLNQEYTRDELQGERPVP